MLKRKHNRTAGFSLIEVVVGIAVLGLVTAPVCASLVLSVRLNAHAQALMNARLQTTGVVETLLAEGIDVAAEDGEDPLWAGDSDGPWTRTLDGVTVTAEQEHANDPFYKVTAAYSVGVEGKEETVVVETRVRAVPEEGGGA